MKQTGNTLGPAHYELLLSMVPLDRVLQLAVAAEEVCNMAEYPTVKFDDEERPTDRLTLAPIRRAA